MEITKKQLEASFELYKDQNFSKQLNHLYESIPGGSCTGCAKCCTESVTAFYVEFLNIYHYLELTGQLEEVSKTVEDHYFNELAKRQDCPFLKADKSCAIYSVRPLVCRLFGYSTREEHEDNYLAVREMNEDADAYFFETYKVHINADVKNHKIEFCTDFIPGRNITMAERKNMIDQLFTMESVFLMADLIPEDAISMSITNWFIYLKYSEEAASDKRIKYLIENE